MASAGSSRCGDGERELGTLGNKRVEPLDILAEGEMFFPGLKPIGNFLEISWLKRNAINYRGKFLHHEDWTMLKFQFDLHMAKKKIEEKLEG